MEAKYAGLSPYNYSMNNPVMMNDPNGADPQQQQQACLDPNYVGDVKDDGKGEKKSEGVWYWDNKGSKDLKWDSEHNFSNFPSKQGTAIGKEHTIAWDNLRLSRHYKSDGTTEDTPYGAPKNTAKVPDNTTADKQHFAGVIKPGTATPVTSIKDSALQITHKKQDTSTTNNTEKVVKKSEPTTYSLPNRNVPKKEIPSWVSKSSTIANAGGIALSIKHELTDFAVRDNGNYSRRTFKALSNESKGFQEIRALGNFGSKYIKLSKGVGVIGNVVGVGTASIQFFDKPTLGSGVRVGVQLFAIGIAAVPLAGWAISLSINAADLIWGDQFYNWLDGKGFKK